MAAIEAECYEAYHNEVILAAELAKAHAQMQASMASLLAHNKSLFEADVLEDEEPSDAEIVAEFTRYETTWKDRIRQLWQ